MVRCREIIAPHFANNIDLEISNLASNFQAMSKIAFTPIPISYAQLIKVSRERELEESGRVRVHVSSFCPRLLSRSTFSRIPLHKYPFFIGIVLLLHLCSR